ncbi:MAG: hypothetical protein QOF46_1761 [Paraburkholderia sp.]|nr:hypothetical protein [Paraburkholderia sp.]
MSVRRLGDWGNCGPPNHRCRLGNMAAEIARALRKKTPRHAVAFFSYVESSGTAGVKPDPAAPLLRVQPAVAAEAATGALAAP